MLFLALLVALVVVCARATKVLPGDEVKRLRSSEISDLVNNAKTTWKAAPSNKFANSTIAGFKTYLGTFLPGDIEYVAPALEKVSFSLQASDLPTSFDARTYFSKCANIISHVRDQSSCGSCWAFGSTEAFNDRFCITTGDAVTLMSPEDTVSCCNGFQCSFSMGCNGGQPAGAWNWFTKSGVSTGGDYGDKGTCKPYSLQNCAHHVEVEGEVSCDTLPVYDTPKCTSSCTDSTYTTPYSSDKHYASSSYSIKGIDNIKKELMEKGTISVAMKVYEDFETYTGGVYQHVTGDYLGGHAIKMIGWGVDNGVNYWICTNSWGPGWGESGSFRIKMGDCGIDDDCVAGEIKEDQSEEYEDWKW